MAEICRDTLENVLQHPRPEGPGNEGVLQEKDQGGGSQFRYTIGALVLRLQGPEVEPEVPRDPGDMFCPENLNFIFLYY